MDSDIIPSSKQKPSGPVPEPPKDQGPEPIDIEPVNFNVDEEPISQPSAPAPSATNFSSEKPKKKSNVVTLLLVLIALCGVGFGVYGIMFAPGMNKKCESPKDLTVKIQSEDGSTITLETDKISTSSDGKTITIADTKSESSSKDYIYIGEWGLKIKIPETLKNVSYTFKQGHDTQGLTVTGAPADAEISESFWLTLNKDAIFGGITRIKKDTCDESAGPCGAIVYEDDEYEYRYSHPQSVYSTEQADIDLETKSVSLIEEMFRNKENYSKF